MLIIGISKINDPMKFSILILRSPSSGVIRTFIDDTQVLADIDIQQLLLSTPPAATPGSLTKSATICVNSNGLFTGARKMAVFVQPNANSASDVDTKGDSISGCSI